MVSFRSRHQHPLRIWDEAQLALMQLRMREPSEVPAQPASMLVSETALSCGQKHIEYFGIHVQACITISQAGS